MRSSRTIALVLAFCCCSCFAQQQQSQLNCPQCADTAKYCIHQLFSSCISKCGSGDQSCFSSCMQNNQPAFVECLADSIICTANCQNGVDSSCAAQCKTSALQGVTTEKDSKEPDFGELLICLEGCHEIPRETVKTCGVQCANDFMVPCMSNLRTCSEKCKQNDITCFTGCVENSLSQCTVGNAECVDACSNKNAPQTSQQHQRKQLPSSSPSSSSSSKTVTPLFAPVGWMNPLSYGGLVAAPFYGGLGCGLGCGGCGGGYAASYGNCYGYNSACGGCGGCGYGPACLW